MAEPAWTGEAFCYLTTVGRRTGRPHTIEIWFGHAGDALYLLAGGGSRADWVRNLMGEPEVGLRVGSHEGPARAEIVTDPEEDALARRLLAAKYQGWRPGTEMSEWARTALPVRVVPDARAGERGASANG